MKHLLAAGLGLVLIAVIAGCGGGGTTTVLRTLTVEEPAKRGADEEPASQKTASDKEEGAAEEPERTVHLQTFRSPSGNIGCQIYEGEARCDIRKRGWKPPPRPSSCPNMVDYGQGISLSQGGQTSFVCAGDTALDPGASSLAYGTASEVGGVECVSREDGITCANRAGHGFFISIQSYQIF